MRLHEVNFGAHIWDRRDANGDKGATACVAIPSFADFLSADGDWRAMAWWIHDHLPCSLAEFYPKLGAFNISWHERPQPPHRQLHPTERDVDEARDAEP